MVLCKWLCLFVQETRKENGENYPATTLRQLLAAFQRIMHTNKIPFNLFDKADLRFSDLHNTLDSVCVKLRKEGIGASVHHAPIITLEDENLFWSSGALGTDNPSSLLRAVFYTAGLHFSLRGGQEHRDLKVDQLTRLPAEGYSTETYYQYVENGSKNYQGRFSEVGQQNKIVRAYASVESERCPVCIFD